MPHRQGTTASRDRTKGLPLPVLGRGFMTDNQMAADLACFKETTPEYVGSSKVSTTFSDSISFAQIQSILNVDVSTSGKIGMFSAGISESYARYIEQNRYSHALYYLANITLPTKILKFAGSGTNILNGIGRDIYTAGNFRAVCGDQLITTASMGGILVVTMIVKFASNYDSQTFAEHVSASYGDIFKASATISNVVTTYGLQGSIEITALQSGGDPTQIAKIFNSCGGHYCITECSFSDMSACTGVVTGVVHYAQTDFVTQVMSDNGAAGAQLSCGVTNVEDFGLKVGPSVLNNTIIKARETLGNIYQAMSINSTFVKHLIGSPYAPYMFTTTVNSLRANNNVIDANLALLNDPSAGAVDCYYNPVNCPSTAATLVEQLQKVDTAFIEGLNRGFVLNAQQYTCECGAGCGGDILDVSGYLFPASSGVNVYLITSNLNLQLTITVINATLNIGGAGTQCPIGRASTHESNLYIHDVCPCPSTCLAASCMLALGSPDTQWYCSSNSCSGAMTVLAVDNPL